MIPAPRRAAALVATGIAIIGLASHALAAPARETGLAGSLWTRADGATERRVTDWMAKYTSGWAPNRGQIGDASGRVAADVLYASNVQGAQVYVTTTGITHYFFSHREEPEVRGALLDRVAWSRLDLELIGAVIRPDRARPEQPLAEHGGKNYFLPHCPQGVLNVPAYGVVRFPEIYPGIDWVLRSEPGQGVHHDFVVGPGADAAQIRFEYQGATSIELSDDQRTLRVRTALGEVREGALLCWQGSPSNPVGARFRLEGSAVSVLLDDYDHSRPLVIDPPLVWSTYYGGSNFDGPRSIFCDNVNNDVYVVGYSASTDLPVFDPGGGALYQGSTGGGVDAFIWKFSQIGVRLWATYFGGSGGELGSDCTIDPSGNLYVCGNTGSADFPTLALAGAYNQSGLNGSNDGFVAKFSALGVMQWSTYLGGSSDDYAHGITTDPGGKIYVCGSTLSTNFPLVNPGGGAYAQGAGDFAEDAFITRFSALNALEWSTYYGGTGDDSKAYGIATGLGRLYVTGYTRSATFPTLNPLGGAYFQPSLASDQDGFIARFTLAGVQTWSTYFGGDDIDFCDEPVVDAAGRAYVCGFTRSTDLPTFNPGGSAFYQGANAGGFDMFLAAFSASNAMGWGTYFGGGNDEFLQGGEGKPLTVDAQGRLYMTAMTASTNLPVLNPLFGSFFQGTNAGNTDAFITQFANNNTLLWSTYFGAADTDFGTSVAVGSGGCLFATGETWELGNLITVNPLFNAWYEDSTSGSDDGYIARFCAPNSACCLDFTCVPASTQAECFAGGGTAFYPGQSCSTVVCTILCTICGRKFADVNRNGVQDNGEVGLAGWTIELRDPLGVLYATMTTDALGDYCFPNIPCGEWRVAEAHQPGWVQTFPTTGSHTLVLGSGSTQNNVNFGNYACASTTPCNNPPSWMGAWWPFAEGAGGTTTADATHPGPARNVALLEGGAAMDSAALCLVSATDFARVPFGDQLGIDFASGSFSIAAWIDPEASTASPRMIVDKRIPVGTLGLDSQGWALYLDGLQSYLDIGTGGTPQVVPGPVVTAGDWSHVVVSVDRASGEGRWYLNGAPAPAFNFTPAAGDVSNTADLYIGQANPAFGAAPGFHGCIADLSLFAAPLSADAANKAWIPGPISWCPEYATMPAVTTMCQTNTSAQVCFTICNSGPTAQTYQWSMAGLPAGPGCSVAGPTNFSPSAGTVVVPAGGCSPPICVTIQRPVGFTAQNAMSCFAMTFVNAATGRCQTRTGKLRVDNSCWCVTPVQAGVVPVPARVPGGTVIGIGIRNPCDPPTTMAYQIKPVWLEPDHPDPVSLSLNGLPPGMPVTGEITVGSGVDEQVDVTVRYPNGYDPWARYEVVLEADTDGDGIMERQAGTVVQAAYDTTQSLGVAEEFASEPSVRLRTSPNPFFGSSSIEFALPRPERVTLGVYDLGGRLVRSLARGQLSAGPHQFAWNGRDDHGRRAAAGVYFVRLDGEGRKLIGRLVKLQ